VFDVAASKLPSDTGRTHSIDMSARHFDFAKRHIRIFLYVGPVPRGERRRPVENLGAWRTEKPFDFYGQIRPIWIEAHPRSVARAQQVHGLAAEVEVDLRC